MEYQAIKLLEEWESGDAKFPVGELLEVDLATAKDLIDAGTAEKYEPEGADKAPAPQDPPSRLDNSEIDAIVKRAVAEVVKAEAKAKPLPRLPRADVSEGIDKDPKGGYKSLGEFMQEVHAADKGLTLRLKATGLSEGVGSEGGFLVPAEFRATLLRKIHEVGLVLGKCQRLPMQTNLLQIPYIAEASRKDGYRGGGVLAYWVDEAGTKTASKPAFGKLSINLKKVIGLVYATDELLSDSVITMDTLINQMVAEEIGFQVDDKIIRGTGAGVPLGILSSPCLITVTKEVGQLANTIEGENIIKMWARMYAPSRAKAVWFINQDVEPQLLDMTLGAGATPNLVYLPPGGLSGAPYATLLGKPVIPIEQCSTLGTVGDIILADMSQYLVGQKSTGIEAATSIHVKFVYDETAFRFVLRVDGQPWWKTALTPYQGTNTVSPFVVLESRT